jgi:starch phosphorylase
MQRFLKIIKGNKPVQFIFAGKAHPKDNEGKKLIQKIFELCRDKDIRKRLVFLEDYDIEVASYMYGGCDIWMNNPRRPLEACGTSGMKAMVNGCLNFSIPDGWWDEAYTLDNRYGFSIGKGEDYADTEYQDFVESRTLYKVLETDIIPDFYDRDHAGMPRTWIRKMKAAFADLGPVFNSHRMVEDYSTIGYLPSFKTYQALAKDNYAPAKDLAAWRMDIMTKWNMIQIRKVEEKDVGHLHVGDPLQVEAEVDLSGIRPEDVSVEIYSGPLDQNGNFAERYTTTMEPAAAKDGVQVFKGKTVPKSPGRFGFTVRIVPQHPLLLDPHSLVLIRWA